MPGARTPAHLPNPSPTPPAAAISPSSAPAAAAAPAQPPKDDTSTVWRSEADLRGCLVCDKCGDTLVEPVASPDCMHFFCKDCIDAGIVPGGANVCPVCEKENVHTALGVAPYQHRKLQQDFVLAELIGKIFPEIEKKVRGAVLLQT